MPKHSNPKRVELNKLLRPNKPRKQMACDQEDVVFRSVGNPEDASVGPSANQSLSGRRFPPSFYQLFDFNPRMRVHVRLSIMRDPGRERVVVFDHGGANRKPDLEVVGRFSVDRGRDFLHEVKRNRHGLFMVISQNGAGNRF